MFRISELFDISNLKATVEHQNAELAALKVALDYLKGVRSSLKDDLQVEREVNKFLEHDVTKLKYQLNEREETVDRLVKERETLRHRIVALEGTASDYRVIMKYLEDKLDL